MYRFFSSIRHGCGSSLTSLLAPKPTLPLDNALRPRRLPQNDGHVRGFSSSNLDWRNLIVNQNVNADANANARPDSMQDTENRNFERWNNMRQNMNVDANAPPNFVQNRGNINSRSWNNMRQNLNAPPNFMGNRENINSRSQNNLGQNFNAPPNFMGNRENINSRSQNNLGQNVDANADALPDFMQDKGNINIGSKNDAETGWNSRPMDFVRGVIDEDNFMKGSSYHQYQYEQDADFVHIKMLRNNTFVTVTDSKGNTKLSGSAGPLKDLKSGQKLSRYAAEATAEVVGRKARGLGLKSVVMKVNGFTHFRRKRNAIMSWKEGFTAGSRGDRNPIVYIEDTTRKPHNGCRLPKKRRI